MLQKNNEKNASVEIIKEAYLDLGYVCSRKIATAIYLSGHLQKPLLIEGPPGVGKTELARATAKYLDAPLIRLQCYEGLDESKALYEWKYSKQLLYIQLLKEQLGDIMHGAQGLEESMVRLHQFGDVFYSNEFLEPRPLLQALREEDGSVLLIDEIDKADQEFEAFLLEILSDYQISIPEIGTVRAHKPPVVFLTSNNTRELSDALKRRCLHLYIPFPDSALEQQIIHTRVPDVREDVRTQLVDFVQALRQRELKKVPAISETIDWARTLVLLEAGSLDADLVRDTLNVLLKYQDDIEAVEPEINGLVQQVLKGETTGGPIPR